MYGDDASSWGVRMTKWRSLKQGLKEEIAMNSRKTSMTKPLEGEYTFKYRPPARTFIVQLIQSARGPLNEFSQVAPELFCT
ncbi:hypothetical protein Zmor_021752 [Zophobas morio]|uniref:Uncharacterized protein n=1 Tax=Zophobas morio TaxID=2755281 RepID=A0AA38I6R8_9CUCU|nr:hypothetical protein Zmor_021752 [Zophobas morio]